MASARPVVSTTTAGISESVVDKETGLLVEAGESGLFADALENLCRNPDLRVRYGGAGRTRIERSFQIETTVQPLVDLLQKHGRSSPQSSALPSSAPRSGIAYLIDRWPDDELPSLDTELAEVRKRNPDITAVVCEFRADRRLTSAMKELAMQLEFLPDAMAIEAEWQANRKLVLALEDDRANETVRAPADLFLRQARFALSLRRMFAQKNISHVHATSSRALLCGVLLKKMLGITLSVSIEAKPPISREVIQSALRHAMGGRIANRKLSEQLGAPFTFDRAGSNRVWVRGLRMLKPVSRIDLTRRASFWQEWTKLLEGWSARA